MLEYRIQACFRRQLDAWFMTHGNQVLGWGGGLTVVRKEIKLFPQGAGVGVAGGGVRHAHNDKQSLQE